MRRAGQSRSGVRGCNSTINTSFGNGEKDERVLNTKGLTGDAAVGPERPV